MDSLTPPKIQDPNIINLYFKKATKKLNENNKYLDKKIFITNKKDKKFKIKSVKKKNHIIKKGGV